ncbi:MAG: DNA/RNA non-specific endonuclease [Bacteroidales bacterium]|nr:DNA/RNA non-specific endonuclease [Bacteroidales bacterium]
MLTLLIIYLQAALGPWMELPAARGQDSTLLFRTHYAVVSTNKTTHTGISNLSDGVNAVVDTLVRNYSFLYDPATYASCWVAYPLCREHIATGREESWGYDPSLPDSLQTGVFKNYSTTRFPTEYYKSNYYARGHQIPNADRGASAQMQAQTYYATNMTPQLQNGFNGMIWAKLEKGIREAALSCSDTLYVVTGASFHLANDSLQTDAPPKQRTVGESRADFPGKENGRPTVLNRNDGKRLPVPSWYWKAVLKVRRDSLGVPVAAKSVAFLLPHRDLKRNHYPEFVISVDSLEALTGFDFFPQLPDSLEVQCERQDDWKAFLRSDCVASETAQKVTTKGKNNGAHKK